MGQGTHPAYRETPKRKAIQSKDLNEVGKVSRDSDGKAKRIGDMASPMVRRSGSVMGSLEEPTRAKTPQEAQKSQSEVDAKSMRKQGDKAAALHSIDDMNVGRTKGIKRTAGDDSYWK